VTRCFFVPPSRLRPWRSDVPRCPCAGLALFYGGMTRAENVLNTVMQSFAITCLISVLWFMMGYSLAFGNGLNPFVGGSDRFWLMGVAPNQSPLLPASLSGTIPESVFMMFQCTFAVITCALITGSFAERMKATPRPPPPLRPSHAALDMPHH